MELDIEDFAALRHYLKLRGDETTHGSASFTRLPGGVSNRTVRVDWADGEGWVLKQALEKLRVNVDWFSSPERIAVEAKGLRWLNRLAPPQSTPDFVFEDVSHYLMAMEAIPKPHQNWKEMLLAHQINSDHFRQFGVLLGTIHRESSHSAEVRREFADTTHFQTLRLDPYYLYAAQTTPQASGFLQTLVRETLEQKDCLVHGDFSPKNTLIYQGRLVLLDYEVVHFGDPGFDLGFGLTHFLSKAHHSCVDRTALTDAARLFWTVYCEQVAGLSWAGELEPRVVRHTLGCLLARVAGKSPLEYLTAGEATLQRDVVLQLMARPPATVVDLISDFISNIEAHANH